MNKRALDTLKKTVEGHTPGPWFLSRNQFGDIIKRNGMPVLIGGSIRERTADRQLAAAAPDLLAEVARLRGWIAFAGRNIKDEWLQRIIAAALDGAEVPE